MPPSPTPPPAVAPPTPNLLGFHAHLLDEFIASHPDYDASIAGDSEDATDALALNGAFSSRRSPSYNSNRSRRTSLSPAVSKSHRSFSHRSFGYLVARKPRLAVRLGDLTNDDLGTDAAHKRAEIVDLDELLEVLRPLGRLV